MVTGCIIDVFIDTVIPAAFLKVPAPLKFLSLKTEIRIPVKNLCNPRNPWFPLLISFILGPFDDLVDCGPLSVHKNTYPENLCSYPGQEHRKQYT